MQCPARSALCPHLASRSPYPPASPHAEHAQPPPQQAGEEGGELEHEGLLGSGDEEMGGVEPGAALPQASPLEQLAAAPLRPAAAAVGTSASRNGADDTPMATPLARLEGEDDGGAGGSTPYDAVLSLLRQGPAGTPRSFPAPRSASHPPPTSRTLGARFGLGATPSPLPPAAALGATPMDSARLLGGSRLGPWPGATASPTTAGRSTYTARSTSRFSRTPVHVPSLAARAQPGSGGAGPSRFAVAAAGIAGNAADGGCAEPLALPAAGTPSLAVGGATLSPAPLAWMPMRSNLPSALRAGDKRKADSASPAEQAAGECGSDNSIPSSMVARAVCLPPACCSSDVCCAPPLHRAAAPAPTGNVGANISILDAQRRVRQKPELEAGGGDARRSWRAGRTPYHPAASSRFGVPPAAAPPPGSTERTASPENARDGAAEPGATPGSGGSKATTDTARRILATLEAFDQAVTAAPAARPAAAKPAVTAPPPPSESLSFAGGAGACRGTRVRRGAAACCHHWLPRLTALCLSRTPPPPPPPGLPPAEPANPGASSERPRVTFGSTSFAPSPATSPAMAKPAAAPPSSGWGDAFLAANKTAAVQATAAAADEAEKGKPKPVPQHSSEPAPVAFGFGLPSRPAAGSKAAITPTMTRSKPGAGAPAVTSSVAAPVSTSSSPLFAFAAAKPAAHAPPALGAASPEYAFGRGARDSALDQQVAAVVREVPRSAELPASLLPKFVFGAGSTGALAAAAAPQQHGAKTPVGL